MESKQRNLEDLMIVWLDEESTSHKSWENQLRSIINYVKVFNNVYSLKRYTIKDGRYELICLIARNRLAEEVLENGFLLDRMQSTYLLGINEQKANHKVRGFFTTMDTLLTQIADDVKAYYEWKNPSSKVFSPDRLFDVNGRHRSAISRASMCSVMLMQSLERKLRETNEYSAGFLWWTYLIREFLDLPVNPESKQKFLNAWRKQYKGNKSELEKLDDFEATYSPDKALYWFTRDCFLYRILNKSLRTENLEYIFKLRFFIAHLHQQLNKLHSSQNITDTTVYRGQIFSKTELRNIVFSSDSLISISSFLSTSTDPAVALMHIENTPEIQGMVSNNWFWDLESDGKYESVFLEIEINKTNTTKSHSFANIREYSCIKDENEVLFSIGSLFQIVEIARLFGGKRHIKLKLVEEDNEIVESILKHYEGIIENFKSPITLATIGNLLPLMGLERKKDDYYRLLLEELPIHHPDIESIKRFSMISVTIIGSDLIRYFQERIVQINQKTFHYFTQQMNCCSIRSLTKYVNQKHFKPAKYFLFVIGTKTLQYEYPSTALRRMIKVYNKFETAYSKSKFFYSHFTTVTCL